MSVLLASVIGGIVTIIVALIGWFGGRRQTNATTEKTTGEGWDLLTKGMAARLTALEEENRKLRNRVAALEETMREHDLPVPEVT